MTDTLSRLNAALERIRPALEMDGGGITLLGFDAATGTVRVGLSGACSGCSNISVTTTMGVERVLKQLVPEVRAVEAIEA